ncbi:HdeD family acid-resistance protein [Actinospica sp. MGRD01-02]|uniref:HdeD family acid-resistance protein n=1 Tax=Actinospica acidithermotolerans TaxID=2828514 RepID=A0A941E979_9ACTN|nr:HdeD family acid-resistance protein [Actinospica acidithermotolerans]MBR7826313.1 HdeD family acid-resistance protein [Actinospica acidithermotolerans]
MTEPGSDTRSGNATGPSGSPGWGAGGQPGVPGPMQQLARSAWQAVALIGLAAIVLGVVALVWPHATLAVLGVLFGIYLLVSGIMQLAAAFGTHTETSLRVLAFISGAISIMLGLFCFRGALESVLLLAIFIGISWIFRGVSVLAAAASDPLMPARGWHIFSGIVGVVAGIVVLAEPESSIWVLTLFAGIWLIVTGLAEIATALMIRSEAKKLPRSY